MRPRAGLKSVVKILIRFDVENSRIYTSSSLGSEGDEYVCSFSTLFQGSLILIIIIK
jgi:hypothetical protein